MVRSCPDSSGHVGSGLAGLGCQDSQLEWFELQIMQGYRAGGQWRCSCRIRFRGSEASFCVGRLQETQSLRQLCENSSGEVSRQAACGEHCLFCSLPPPSLSLSLSLSPFLSLCLCPPPQALQFSRDMLGGCLPSCEHCRQPALTCRPAAKICWKARLWPQTGNPVYRRHDTQEGAVQHGDVTRVIRHHAP